MGVNGIEKLSKESLILKESLLLKFTRFLKKNRSHSKFQKGLNTRLTGGTVQGLVERTLKCSHPSHLIGRGFNWNATEDGIDYWSNLDDKWQSELQM